MKTLLLMLAVVPLYAQNPILEYSGGPIDQYPVDGYSNRSYLIFSSATPLDESATGADLLWNFNDLTAVAAETVINLVPTASELAAFPNTYMVSNLARHALDGTVLSVGKEYISMGTNNTRFLNGFEEPDLLLQLNFTDHLLIGAFSLEYGDSVSDVIAGTYDYDTYSGTFSGTTTSTVDAYGSLSTNGFDGITYEVTRLKILANFDFAYGAMGDVGTMVQVKNYYYREGDLFPFFKSFTTTINIPLLGVNETSTELRQANPALLNSAEIIYEVGPITFQNPVANELILEETPIAITAIKIYDTVGKCVLTKSFDGSNTDVSTLAQGMYLIHFITDQGIISRKMLKN